MIVVCEMRIPRRQVVGGAHRKVEGRCAFSPRAVEWRLEFRL